MPVNLVERVVDYLADDERRARLFNPCDAPADSLFGPPRE